MEVTTEEKGTPTQMAALYGALAAAQGEFQPIIKNRSVEIAMKTGGKYRFRYADLEEVTAKTRPALAKNGLATTQPVETRGNVTVLCTRLVHADGGVIESEIVLPPHLGGDIKNYGATLSYLRRYAKSSILDVAADDDLDEDGQEPEQPAQQQRQQQTRQQTQQQDGGRAEPQPYDQAAFDANLPAWTERIQSGKQSPDQIIKFLSSKSVLTEEQKNTILNIKGKDQ